MDDATMNQLLRDGEYGILSTVGPDLYPYGVPMNYVYLDNAIYFHGASEGHKHENIKSNDKVSFCIIGRTNVIAEKFTTNYESIIVFGDITSATGEEKLKALFAMVEKYSPTYSEKGKDILVKMSDKIKVLKLNVKHISGKIKGY